VTACIVHGETVWESWPADTGTGLLRQHVDYLKSLGGLRNGRQELVMDGMAQL